MGCTLFIVQNVVTVRNLCCVVYVSQLRDAGPVLSALADFPLEVGLKKTVYSVAFISSCFYIKFYLDV